MNRNVVLYGRLKGTIGYSFFSSFFHSYFILNAEYDEMTQFVKEKENEETRKRIY